MESLEHVQERYEALNSNPAAITKLFHKFDSKDNNQNISENEFIKVRTTRRARRARCALCAVLTGGARRAA